MRVVIWRVEKKGVKNMMDKRHMVKNKGFVEIFEACAYNGMEKNCCPNRKYFDEWVDFDSNSYTGCCYHCYG